MIGWSMNVVSLICYANNYNPVWPFLNYLGSISHLLRTYLIDEVHMQILVDGLYDWTMNGCVLNVIATSIFLFLFQILECKVHIQVIVAGFLIKVQVKMYFKSLF
ncbi:hypothetical protein Dimus_026987 [Dionaea muscipula]